MSDVVSALGFPNQALFREALASGEVKKLLGAGPGELLVHRGSLGVFCHKYLPGSDVLGEQFFAWEPVQGSPTGARLGRLLDSDVVARIVGEQSFRAEINGRVQDVAAIPQAINVHVERFRGAVEAKK